MRQKLKIEHAESLNNGIRFYSKRHKNHVAIATINEQGNISTKWTTTAALESENKKNKPKVGQKRIIGFTLFFIAFFCVLYPLFRWASSQGLVCYLRTLCLINTITILSIFLRRVYVKRKKQRVLYQFHSAEHMVCNAYSKLNRVPSLEEIHQFSRFDKDCSTNVTTLTLLFYLLVLACSFIPCFWCCLITFMVGWLITLIFQDCGLLNFLQYLTTIPPTDTELRVAIAGMSVWLENEQKEKEKSKFTKFLYKLFPRVFR